MAAATSRARKPLIVGGAAAAGLAGGLAVLNRRRANTGLVERVRAVVSGGDGSLDLDFVTSAARRISSLGEQVAAVTSALQESTADSKKT